ncbi:MAG TPA: deoxyribodipyrimidine photo-lyase [Candidatus Lustribacter sp.]|nr:deoxyribodipyrimidine photo-lyase [Candidatus Lustribacter sp.]
MTPTVLWLRRDLRLLDHPALGAAHAAGGGGPVLPLFVIDPALWAGSSPARRCRLAASLRSVHARYDGRLVVRTGSPELVVAQVAAEAGATSVHISAETTPYGRRRDGRVRQALAAQGRPLVATGTPYAIGPGALLTAGGTPFQVFTPFRRAWLARGWPQPAPVPPGLRLARGVESEPLPRVAEDAPGGAHEAPGELVALDRWAAFAQDGLDRYSERRNRPDLDGTSRLSEALKYGEVHPRTLLAGMAGLHGSGSAGAADFTSELCWREFYADVLWHQPHSAWSDLKPALARMTYDEPGEAAEAWAAGRTGYPIVDAGMRQLLTEGWMHNRVRMLTASFLVKDLHVWWPYGARVFLRHLRDGDLASNSHGWQWTAGTGTDAAPYVRIFNPVTQGLRFDPDGDYVRRHVPELGHLRGAGAHEPWAVPDGYAQGYPQRIVDHASERTEALRRYAEARQSARQGDLALDRAAGVTAGARARTRS